MNDNADIPESAAFRLLDLDLDLHRRTVSRGGERIDLPDLSFKLLSVLVRHAPDDVSKDDLIREVWGDVVVGDETLAQRVRLLRQALGEDSQNPRYVASVRGRGYRLACEVQPALAQRVPSRGRYLAATIAGVVFLFGAIWMFTTAPDDGPIVPAANSIAVLPFTDLSRDKNHGYFADGMQEELLTRLTEIDGLHVASRTTAEPFRDTDLGIPDIATAIGVGAIIEGSVRLDADRVRVTVQLIDANTDRHLWADNFDRTLSVQSIFSIQEEVAGQIAEALRLEYASDAGPGPVQLPTADLDAYSAFLLGRYHTFRQTPEDLDTAVAQLTIATKLDPEFAEAWAALGWAYSFLGTNYGNVEPAQVYPLAKEAAMRALALDPQMSDARTLYADILTWYDWDFEAAEREYQKTMELDPLNVLGYALFLSARGRDEEAIELIERRILAQPDDPYVHVNAAWRFFGAGRYERALDEARLAGDHPDANSVMGMALISIGEPARAIEDFQSDLIRQGRLPSQLSNLAVAYFAAGQISSGQALLDELRDMAAISYFSPAILADAEFAAGDTDAGFESLKRAVDYRVRGVIFLPVHGMLDGLRNDPRYEALIAAAGL